MPGPRLEQLNFVYEGWSGYQQSLVSAIAELTPEQLAFRAGPELRSVGEIAWHIADGRVDWFRRMSAPKSAELQSKIEARKASPNDPQAICSWLEETWEMVQATLNQWSVADLTEGYRHEYQGQAYAVSRQWTIWRIMCHDIHHGGQLSELLAMQGIEPLELTLLGGHLTVPDLAD